MNDLCVTCRCLHRHAYAVFGAVAVSVLLCVALAGNVAAQSVDEFWIGERDRAVEIRDIDDPPPRWVQGDHLLRPIPPAAMLQMAHSVIVLADSTLADVDQTITAAQQLQDKDRRDNHVSKAGARMLHEHLQADGKTVAGLHSLSMVREEMQRQLDHVVQIAQRYRTPVTIPLEETALSAYIDRQTSEARDIHTAVHWLVSGRFYALDWLLDLSVWDRSSELFDMQKANMETCQETVNRIVTRRRQAGESVDLGSLILETRDRFGDEERTLVDAHIRNFQQLARQTQDALDRASSDLQRLLDSTPSDWREIPFYYDLISPIQQAVERSGYAVKEHMPVWPGSGLVLDLSTYFHLPEVAEIPLLKMSIADYERELRSDRRNSLPRASIDFTWDVILPSIRACRHKEPEVRDDWPKYPRYFVNAPPSIPQVQMWGTGVPGPETNDWSHLIPQAVIDEHELNGRWIILAVYGSHIIDMDDFWPEPFWPPEDKHLDYKLLHCGTFSMEKVDGSDDPQWHDFWRALNERNESLKRTGKPALGIENADVAIIGVRLAPTSAGRYEFELGDVRVSWVLPEATNTADTHFARALGVGRAQGVGVVRIDPGPEGKRMRYERITDLFLHDRFHVEIETAHDVLEPNRIPIDLYKSSADGEPTPIDFRAHALYAERVNDNPKLFRSPLICLNKPQATAGTRVVKGKREFWVPLRPGDRVAARVVPHGAVRQGALALAQVHSTPDKVSAFWYGAVVDAAKIANIEMRKPPSKMSDGELYIEILRKPWKTVDSTPFVEFGGREVKLTVGHLAAMLLIRNQFIASMEEALPRLQSLRDKLNANPNLKRTVWAMLEADALRANSPIGDLEVLDWDPARRTTIQGKTIPFRNAYDEAWLEKTFRGLSSHQIEWQDDTAMFVFNGYVTAAEETLKHARQIDVSDAEVMLRLTGIGMRSMVSRLRPNLLRLVEDRKLFDSIGIGFRWEYNRLARQYVSYIEGLGAEFLANEARVDKINATTAVVAAVVAVFLPEVYIGQMIAAGISAGSMMMTVTRELPEFIGREEDVRFAIGAYLVIGQERYITAELRRKPGWAMALELAGGSIDVVANVAKLRHAEKAWIPLSPDTEVAELFTENPRVFAAMPREEQMSALTRLAHLSNMQKAGEALSEIEMAIVNRGMKMMEDMETVIDTLPPRYHQTEVVGRAQTVIMRGGQPQFAVSREIVEIPKTVREELADIPVRFQTHQLTQPIARRQLFSLTPNEPWATFKVGEHVGSGVICQVYALLDEADPAVLKVTRDLLTAREDIARVLHCRDMIDGIVPQMPIKDSGFVGRVGYLVQERIPKGADLLEVVRGTIAEDTLPRALAENQKYQRTIGVLKADGTVGPMLREQTHAICDLYKKLIANDIIWFDGHLGNVALIERDGRVVAHVIDQDFMWRWQGGRHFLQGPVGQSQGGLLERLYRFDEPYIQLRLQSMIGHRPPSRAARMIFDGKHLYPDAEFFMYKQLERFGYINYVRGKGWVDGAMELKHVKEIFPNIEDARFIDPDLGQLLPQSSIQPTGDLPGGSGDNGVRLTTIPIGLPNQQRLAA